MDIIRIINMVIILTLMSVFSLFAQSTEKILLVFNQGTNHIIFPCLNISTCIDTLYYKGDTLSIRLKDNRHYYLDTCYHHKILYCTRDGANKINARKVKRQLNIPIIKPECNFVEIQIYDEMLLLKKKKKDKYVLISRQELENKIIAKIRYAGIVDECFLLRWRFRKTNSSILYIKETPRVPLQFDSPCVIKLHVAPHQAP